MSSALLSVTWLEEIKPEVQQKVDSNQFCASFSLSIFFFFSDAMLLYQQIKKKRSGGFNLPLKVVIGEAWEGYKKMC